MNTKTSMMICLLLIGAIALGSNTYAVFSDTETSEGNTITVSTDYDNPVYETVTLTMENINERTHGGCIPHPQLPSSDLFNLSDDIGGNFTYNTAGPEFVYDFEATVFCSDREYVLVTFQLKDHGNHDPVQFDPHSGVMLNNGTASAAGKLLLNGTMELDGDLEDTPVFLVLSKKNGFCCGNLGGNWAQDCLYHLYSVGLIQYDDTDVPD